MANNDKQSLVVGERRIKSTMDYSLFKTMPGNREVNRRHVRELIRLLNKAGNLTNQFPIVVNENMEVIDGQHRLEALKELGWEVAYIQEKGATLNMVRAINLGNKNWNWRDVAQSFADLGNKEYEWFLRYIDRHNLGFTVACRFSGLPVDKRNGSDYYQGYLFVEHKTKAEEMAEHFKEALKYVNEEIAQREFGIALNNLSKSAAYDRDRMIEKLKEKGYTLPNRATIADFMRKLEEIYNDKLQAENKVRLF